MSDNTETHTLLRLGWSAVAVASSLGATMESYHGSDPKVLFAMAALGVVGAVYSHGWLNGNRSAQQKIGPEIP